MSDSRLVRGGGRSVCLQEDTFVICTASFCLNKFGQLIDASFRPFSTLFTEGRMDQSSYSDAIIHFRSAVSLVT